MCVWCRRAAAVCVWGGGGGGRVGDELINIPSGREQLNVRAS